MGGRPHGAGKGWHRSRFGGAATVPPVLFRTVAELASTYGVHPNQVPREYHGRFGAIGQPFRFFLTFFSMV
jgi:hypothetical protein